MDISDYIPIYPELNNPEFNNIILHKEEFYDLRSGSKAEPFGEPGDLWPHQELLARFVSPYTMYDKQVLFHTPGTGKTCGATAVVEANKLDPTVRKPVLVIVPNDTLVDQWKRQIAMVCTAGIYVPEGYFSEDPAERLTEAEKTTRINKLLKPVYTITTLERMRREIDRLDDQILHDRYSNRIVIIDEAHNLRIQSNAKRENIEDSKGRYNAFHRFLHIIDNSKVLLLSGTPMYDRIHELPGLMNLILPMDEQLPVGREFTKKYLQIKPAQGIKNEKSLFKKLVGKVSYIREGGNFPKREDLGVTVWTRFIKTMPVKMSKLQLAGYREAYLDDTSREKNKVSGLWKNSRQAAVFVYKHNDKYLWGAEASKLLTAENPGRRVTIKGREITYTRILLKREYKTDIKNNLKEYSAKYAYIVDFVDKHQREPTFIFTPLVSGAGGAIFLGLVLELFGYSKARGVEDSPGKRYALITGDDKSTLQRNALIEIFNSPENVNGELIQVMIATKTIAEGTSFTNVRHEIVVSPYWNNSGTEQALGRGLRANSLMSLPDEERIVTVQQLASASKNLPAEDNIDAHMYKMSEVKDYIIKAAERFLKRVAWDCALNYERNVRINDKNKSRSCDYQKCNYVCYQTKPQKTQPRWSYSVPEDDLDKSTYILYFSNPDLVKLAEQIKEVLTRVSYIDIQQLADLLQVENFKLFILAIEYIIENHIIVRNKWGQPCFMHHDNNMIYLSDSAAEDNISATWYAKYPYANQRIPLSRVIDDELLEEDLGLVSCKNVTKLNDMNIESKIFVLEQLLLMEGEIEPEQQEMYNKLLTAFETHIFKIGDMTIHNLEKIKLDLDYIDFKTGPDGDLRCLRVEGWDVCDKKEEEEFSGTIQEAKEAGKEDIIDNPYGIYGVISTDKKFKLVDLTKEKVKTKRGGGQDRRTQVGSRACKPSWKKAEIIEVYLRTGTEPSIPIDKTLTNRKELLAALDEKTKAVIPKKADIKTLQKVYTLKNQKVDELCDQLKRWFEAEGLLIHED